MNIITPNNKIIGSKPVKSNKVKSQNIEIELEREEKTDFTKEIEYNKNINTHPDFINNLMVKDNHVLIKLFKFEKPSTSTGGIILEDTELYQTEGGRTKARVKINPYQKRGVVVKTGFSESVSDFSKALNTPGTVVHVPTNEFKEFHIDKTKKMSDREGYFLVHLGVIEVIEK